MGGTSTKPAMNHAQAELFMQKHREKFSSQVLCVMVKDQNHPGKLCMSGAIGKELEDAITTLLSKDKHNKKAEKRLDKYDLMYDVVWRNTSFTTGHSMMSLQKSYFPRGKLIISLLDLLASHGWTLSACPNFGGVESRDDKGNVTSCVDWPVLVFYKDLPSASKFTPEHLFLSVKDSNNPGKLCVAGPISKEMESELTATMRQVSGKENIESKTDKYDHDYDVVYRHTSITSGVKLTSMAKSYFPKGQTVIAILETVYKYGWRLQAAPNFGGTGDSWPCFVLRKLADPDVDPPELLLASIKDSNIPGKLCLAGRSAAAVVDPLQTALARVPKNEKVHSEKDKYDDDYDAVLRDVNITTGCTAFSLKLPYYPRCDSMLAFIQTMYGLGFGVAACPNFGGMLDSWPTFLFEAHKEAGMEEPLFVSIKDDNIPGKLNFGGAGIKDDAQFAHDMLETLQKMCGDKVSLTKDDYDSTFDYCFKNTILTSGHAAFSWAQPYWPHGYIVEAVLDILHDRGYKVVGGPNFGDDGNRWPCFIATRSNAASAPPPEYKEEEKN